MFCEACCVGFVVCRLCLHRFGFRSCGFALSLVGFCCRLFPLGLFLCWFQFLLWVCLCWVALHASRVELEVRLGFRCFCVGFSCLGFCFTFAGARFVFFSFGFPGNCLLACWVFLIVLQGCGLLCFVCCGSFCNYAVSRYLGLEFYVLFC